MKTLTPLLALAAALPAAADPAGLRLTDLDMPHHDAQTEMAIWYPNGGGGEDTVFAENPVFQGVDAALGADVKDGAHPIVVFSHGMGGTFRAQAWLGSELANRGAIVISVDHINSTWRSFDMSKGVQHWTRNADLSVALDRLLADPDFADHIDPTRIMAAGFSFGGWSALSMGGMRGNHAGLVETCQRYADTMAACDTLLSDDVNLPGIDPDLWNQSYADARITHVTALDPGFVWGLTPQDTRDLVPNVLMIGLGGPDTRMSATDFDQSGLAKALPDATINRIAPGFHFTAMPLCTPAGEAILSEDNDDPVCTDPQGTDRAQVHAEIVDAMARQLGL